LSENVANQETDELVTVERCELEAFGEDGNRSISQERLDVAPTSFLEPEMEPEMHQVASARYYFSLTFFIVNKLSAFLDITAT